MALEHCPARRQINLTQQKLCLIRENPAPGQALISLDKQTECMPTINNNLRGAKSRRATTSFLSNPSFCSQKFSRCAFKKISLRPFRV